MDVLSIMSLKFEEWRRSSMAVEEEEESPSPGSGSGSVEVWPELEHCEGKVNPRRELGSNCDGVSPALGFGGRLLFGISCSPGRRHLM